MLLDKPFELRLGKMPQHQIQNCARMSHDLDLLGSFHTGTVGKKAQVIQETTAGYQSLSPFLKNMSQNPTRPPRPVIEPAGHNHYRLNRTLVMLQATMPLKIFMGGCFIGTPYDTRQLNDGISVRFCGTFGHEWSSGHGNLQYSFRLKPIS